MSNVGRTIQDFFCNGFAGRRYDMAGAIIEAEGRDWIVARTTEGEPVYMEFIGYENGKPTWDGWHFKEMQENIDKWCNEPTQDW